MMYRCDLYESRSLFCSPNWQLLLCAHKVLATSLLVQRSSQERTRWELFSRTRFAHGNVIQLLRVKPSSNPTSCTRLGADCFFSRFGIRVHERGRQLMTFQWYSLTFLLRKSSKAISESSR